MVHDIAYGSDARHRLDVYRPQNERAAPHAVMIFMPGGGFIRGDKSDREKLEIFRPAGIAVVVANYRLAPEHVWPAGEDVIAAYRWITR